MNVTVNCGTQSITFVGVDVLKPKSIDMAGAFVCNETGTNKVLGMNSSSKSWNQVVSDLGMGGYSDYVELTLPVTYSSSNNITWCSDTLTNCTDVNLVANCSSGGTGKTDCKIPSSLGFSAYQLVPLASSSNSDTSTTTGSSGGAANGTTTFWNTIAFDDQEFKDKGSITRLFIVRDRLRVKISGQSHYVGLISLTAATATVNVSSTPQQATFAVNDSKKFDVDDDKYYDLSITLNDILQSGTKANFTVLSINEKMPDSETPPSETTPGSSDTVATNESGEGTSVGQQEKTTSTTALYIIIGVIILLFVIGGILYARRLR